MNDQTSTFLRKCFRKYYFKQDNSVETPDLISSREFGYLPFGGFMTRHLQLNTAGELHALLVKESPLGVYCSCAYYENPTAVMPEKEWQGGDLSFDIDADDLELDCKKVHDRWICKQCQKIGNGLRPAKCVSCSGTRLFTLNWSCDKCLNGTKKEIIKLKELLMEDFAIQESGIHIFFSGDKGYHLIVDGSQYENVDQYGRAEIAQYMSLKGFETTLLGLSKRTTYNDALTRISNSGNSGWRGRLYKFFNTRNIEWSEYNLTENSTPEEKLVTLFYNSKKSKFSKLIKDFITEFGVVIDPVVTTDIHRIFRLPGSLHEKTGLSKKRCLDIDQFNHSIDPVELSSDYVKINVKFSPGFKLLDNEFGPYNNETLDLPEYAASYILANKLGEYVEN